MKIYTKSLLILVLVLFTSSCAPKLSPPGNDQNGSVSPSFSYRPVDRWLGERFMFHPRPPSLQQFYYPNITGSGKIDATGNTDHPAYDDVAEKTCSVSGITPQKDGSFLITLEMDDSGTVYAAKAVEESVDGLIPYRDIEDARKMFVGKEFFLLKDNLLSDDDATGTHQPVNVPRYTKLEVVAVQPGSSTKTPVRVVLLTPQKATGFIELNLSGTNVPLKARGQNRFEDYLSVEDPNSWHKDIHDHIANKRVRKGMTPTQAKLSWGSPHTVETVATPTGLKEKWFYPYGDMLLFENGKLKESGKPAEEK